MALRKDPATDAAAVSSRERRIRAIRRASWVGIIGNGFLSVLKMSFGVIAGSFALISDGIDSLTDVLTSGITLFTATISSKPPDLKHPYGHGRAETIATKVLAFIIFFAGSQLVVSAVRRLFQPEAIQTPSTAALYIAAVSIAGKVFLGIYKKRIGTIYRSSMLKADAKNMRNDVLISSSVFTGILFSLILNMPVIDTLIAAAIGVYILISALGIFTETSLELMDGISDHQIYQEVFDAVNSVEAAGNPHKTRIRKFNNMYIIDMDIEVDGSMTVEEGHAAAMEVEANVRNQVSHVYDIHVHVEPKGNVEHKESFGISEDLLR